MIHLLWCTIRPDVFKQMHPYWNWVEQTKCPISILMHVVNEDHIRYNK